LLAFSNETLAPSSKLTTAAAAAATAETLKVKDINCVKERDADTVLKKYFFNRSTRFLCKGFVECFAELLNLHEVAHAEQCSGF
jgi:hypothetical protein